MSTKSLQTSQRILKHQSDAYRWSDLLIGSGVVPDFLLKLGVMYLIKKRLKESSAPNPEIRHQNLKNFIEDLKKQPVALSTETVNAQHYELPSDFFEIVLGKQLKYSCSYFKSKKDSLDEAESNMLELYVKRAEIKNGDEILELGCGWGSLTLHLARNFPKSKITALSNSNSQRKFINSKLKEENLKNVTVITKNINNFDTQKKFNKIVSIEMFEHVRNYQRLFQKINKFLKKGGLAFIHIFAHKEIAYPFEAKDDSDWMSKYFFTGGTMPSSYLFSYFIHPLKIKEDWIVSGKHYHYTSYHWLRNMDENRARIIPIFKNIYGKRYKLWYQYWRIFFIAVAELFGYRQGDEWIIHHYLFEKI